jgi:hypothetical protein
MGVFGTAIRPMGNGVVESRWLMTNYSAPNLRVLKVSETGNFYRKHTWPYLRLTGFWLMRAGIYPNMHVCIENPQPGVLVIKVQDDHARAN